jgi:hypothetical protein
MGLILSFLFRLRRNNRNANNALPTILDEAERWMRELTTVSRVRVKCVTNA